MKIYDNFNIEIDTKLTELELLFKEIYLSCKDRHLDQPHSIDESKDIFKLVSNTTDVLLPQIFLNSLSEDTFFKDNLDVALCNHIRYLPTTYHQHDFFEVTCLLEGYCTNYFENKKINMKPGDYCIIAPNTIHTISAFSDDCFMINILLRSSTFEKSFISTFSDNDILSDFFIRNLYNSKEMSYILFHTGADSEVRNYIGFLHQEINRNRPYKKRMINSILTAFFVTLLRNHENDVVIPSLNNESDNKDIISILRYIQNNYNLLTLKELSLHFNYSERHLQRIIKASTGVNFSENIQKLKMNRAAELLNNGNISIAEISEKLGYSDVRNFRHIFKKYYGMTPIEFRNLEN